MKQSQIDRAARYRKRAGDTRSKADRMNDRYWRTALLEAAETWERLADQEEGPGTSPAGRPPPPRESG